MAKINPSEMSNLKSKIEDPQSLRVLIVEDSEDDALLEIRALKKGGYAPVYERVETAAAMLSALKDKIWDIILADFEMPHFSGTEAIALLQETNIDIPLVIVSGTIGEETAVECMRMGAHDYIMKGNLTRLVPAVEREIAAAGSRLKRRSAEAAILESEEQFRTLADSGSALIWTSGTDKKCYYFNRPWLNFTGRTLEQEIGDGWMEGVHPDDLAHCIEIYTSAFDRRERFSITYRLRHHSGEYCWIQDDGTPRQAAGGNFIGYIGHCLDITAHKLAEERSLQKSRLLTAINNIFYEAMTAESEQEVFQTCLNVALEVTGSQFGFIGEITPEGLFSTTALSAPRWKACRLPETESTRMLSNMVIRGLWGQVLLKESSLLVNDPLSFPDRVGTPEWHPPITSFLGVPLKERNKTFGMIAVANRQSGYTDDLRQYLEAISVVFVESIRRKQVEEALKESEKKYRELYDFLPISIFEIDAQGTVISLNPTALKVFGYGQENTNEGITAFQFFEPTQWERLGENIQKVIKGTSIPGQEFIFLRKNGSTFPGLIYASPIIQANKTVGIRGAIIDITERKHLEEKLVSQLDELRRWQDIMLDREDRVSELKHEVNELNRRLSEPLRYPSQENATDPAGRNS